MPGSVIDASPKSAPYASVLDRVKAEGREVLLENEAQEVVKALGIAVPDSVFIRADENLLVASENAWESLWGQKVVVKVVSPEILHKTDLGGVKIVDKLPAAIFDAVEAMQTKLRGFDVRGYLVSELVEYDAAPGGELLVNIRWTDELGPVVSLGLGGVSAEFLASNLVPGTEIAVFAPGLTPRDQIASILEEKVFARLLTGSLRNQQPRLQLEELKALVERLLDLASESFPVPFDELEINPLVLGPHGLTALDALVRIGQSHATSVPRPLDKISRLLEPRSIAVVGVSGNNMNPGRIIVRNLLREGFDASRITIVKEGCEQIDGCGCVKSIQDLPAPVDLMVLSIGADAVPSAMREVIEHEKAESVIVIPGGIGEREGTSDLESSVRRMIEETRSTAWRGPLVNGGNSLGIRSISASVDTMFLPHHKVAPAVKPGAGIAVISQSGAFAVSLASRLAPISPRMIISIGNQIDLTAGDYLEALVDDPSLDVLAFYVEGFRAGDARQWLDAARRARQAGKAVILYRAGRTPQGQKATASHTAAMAGDAVVIRELARSCGAVVAESLDDFEDLIRTFWLLRDRTPEGVRTGAVSNAGFECVAIADNPGPFRFVAFSEATTDRVRDLFRKNRLDAIMNVGNPLDVNPMMGDEAFSDTVRSVLTDPGIDIVIVGCVPLSGALQTLPAGEEYEENLACPESVASRLIQLWRHSRKPWVAVIDAGEAYDPLARHLLDAGIPTFRRADRAMRILESWVGWKQQSS